MPNDLPPVDLILHLSETPQAAELLPAVVEVTGARGVVASSGSCPLDSPWPAGTVRGGFNEGRCKLFILNPFVP